MYRGKRCNPLTRFGRRSKIGAAATGREERIHEGDEERPQRERGGADAGRLVRLACASGKPINIVNPEVLEMGRT